MRKPYSSLQPLISFYLSVFLLGIFTLSSCIKDESSCIAKKSNGGINVNVYPVYNGKPVVSRKAYRDTAYIKYGVSSNPGTSLSKYDIKLVAPEGSHFVNISKLNCGTYYFFVACQDSATGQRLTGGTSLITDKIVGNFDIVVPVYGQ